MEVHDEYIPERTFATCLERLPQVCVEVVVRTDVDDDGDGDDVGVLLVRRTNEPAAGEWFWPGGRLYKGEHLDDAAHRIARAELDIEVHLEERLGVHSHFWTATSVAGVSERHTVNVVYRASPVEDDPDIGLDDQHDDYRWLTDPSAELHEYVRRYVREYGLLDGRAERN